VAVFSARPLWQSFDVMKTRWLLVLALAWPALLAAATLTQGPDVEILSNTEAVLRWSTDVATGGRVHYGTDPLQLTQRGEDAVGGKHEVKLTGLRPATKYFFTVGTARVPLATNSFSMPGFAPAPPKSPPTVVVKTGDPAPKPAATARKAPPTRETWGNLASLRDHFERHGPDFKSKDQDEYARQAWEFLQRAKAEGLPTKVDEEGVTRVFDPKTRAFAAYNRDGTTKTYFRPNSRDYFERQPGKLINPKTLKF
jgi:hypothetical protein